MLLPVSSTAMQAVPWGHTRRGFLDKPGAALGKEVAQVGVVVPDAAIPCVRRSLLQSPMFQFQES